MFFSTAQAYATWASDQEPPLLQQLRAATLQHIHGAQMLSSSQQGRILAFFSRLVQPQCILEIGTYTGYSALCLVEGLREGGKLHTIDRSSYALTQDFFDSHPKGRQIHFHQGRAEELLYEQQEMIDLLFIDADKKQYGRYYDLLIDKVRPGGLIIADNMLWKGKVLSPKGCEEDPRAAALKAFIETRKMDKRINQLFLPVEDGLWLGQKLSF